MWTQTCKSDHDRDRDCDHDHERDGRDHDDRVRVHDGHDCIIYVLRAYGCD